MLVRRKLRASVQHRLQQGILTDDFVSEQNKTLTELLRENDRLKRALRSLAEKIETLDGNGNVPPANEKPPHW